MEYLSAQELAKKTGRATSTILNMAKKIPGGRKFSNRWFFPVQAVDYVKGLKAGAPKGNKNWNGKKEIKK